MKSCCESKSGELAELRASQGKVLKILLALNASMFFVEFTAAWWLGSTALLGDSLDMFGDASVYALTLYVLHRSVRERAMSALIKGIVMLALGLIVLGEAGYQALNGVAPAAHGMGAFALLALAVNLICFGLLWRFKSDDLNMRSTWLCSRNDIIANASVFGAAILVGWTGSRWPDVLLGAAIAALFLQSAWQVIRDAREELREARQAENDQIPDDQDASSTSSCCTPPTAAVVIEQPHASTCCSSKRCG
ncbi:cation transporter [Cobetia sp. cqz5-12]|uniref:cation transporter n=1 Tax=unclassified Cobetia TaxID=2609414 RepID=UPI00140B2CB6|nr:MULTISPECIES: cation diffusion facilitator family transporter [unclassified Cobetia]NHH87159.1 Cadmium, cobalt and zinc/H(+)-K(+) antiporter [Cobetia sp. MB87]QQK64415.1 cation transporter [Cobetia sp. cqz5-12]